MWRPAAGDPTQELPMAYDRPTSLAWSRRGEIAFTAYASEPDQPNESDGIYTESGGVTVVAVAADSESAAGSVTLGIESA